MNYDRVIKQARKKYGFLKEVCIDVVNDFGKTSYNPQTNSIVLYLKHINEFYKTSRFKKRLGKANFSKSFLLCLLHEIHHVYQEQTIDPQVLLQEKLKIEDAENHDDSWLEQEADQFAKKEIKNWDLTKFKS